MVDQDYGDSWVTSLVKGMSMHMIRLRREFGFNADMRSRVRWSLKVTSGLTLKVHVNKPLLGGKFEIEVQDYGELCLMPMVTVKGKVTSHIYD
ncbi:Glucoside Xylosyltransferase 1 [Manis pentadactyla]|nr:Glucoside Xylosyltransferase 1 [Manis pentadactyla]